MRSFIIRPFGTKQDIDFDAVERDLIEPALSAIKAEGRTTGEILEAGNIRTDMFAMLLQADLVIADITLHNANVFYELGIRHAYRPRMTMMIRGSKGDRHVFDLATDRYFTYDSDAPGNDVERLVAALRQSMGSERIDSPVLDLVPEAMPSDPKDLIPAPRAFVEEVERATPSRGDIMTPGHAAKYGHLAVLAEEAATQTWAIPGQRMVGRSLFNARRFDLARQVYARITETLPDDRDANSRLATIYRYLDEGARSDAAIDRALGAGTDADPDDVEFLALRGANAKSRWELAWNEAARPDEAALSSAHLDAAIDAYRTAFHADLNHVFSGINALTLLTIRRALAQKLPEIWEELHEEEAAVELSRMERDVERLTQAVRLASDLAQSDASNAVWSRLTQAEIVLLTGKPEAARRAYKRALEIEGAGAFHADSARRQIELLRALGIREDAVEAVLEGFPPPDPQVQRVSPVWLFSGHRVDTPDRARPRFPNTPEAIEAATTAIRRWIDDRLDREGKPDVAISGLANGGDILFQELCAERGIPQAILLPYDRSAFARDSVQDGGNNWMERYDALLAASEPIYLDTFQMRESLPDWLAGGDEEYGIWERNNRWLLQTACAYGIPHVRVVVLWDEQAGAAGGTADMVNHCRERGIGVSVLPIHAVLDGIGR